MADGLYQPPEKAQSGRITEMPAEFEGKTKEIIKDPAVEQKLSEIVGEAGKSFPACFARRRMNAAVTSGF